MRDRRLLEAALYRPQTGYYGDLIEESAALWESLAQTQPFMEGNKRTAFAFTYTVLAINGGRIAADALVTHKFIIGLHEAGTFDLGHLTAWLRNTVSPE